MFYADRYGSLAQEAVRSSTAKQGLQVSRASRSAASTRSPSPSGTVDYKSRARSPWRGSERETLRDGRSTYELRTGMLESQRRHAMAITRTEDLTYQLLREELEFAGPEQEKL
ncbi:hypothetical protein DTO063F5_3995 [Paecilomyces variotii]|nr:hypothetical protein DTO063F5_3995 [Paecilomyces variotii]